MKLTVILILCGLLQVSARTTAQTRISMSVKGATLEKIFSEIEKRSGYTVFYNTEVLKAAGASLVSLDVKDATIEDVMHQCLRGLPLEFTVQDKTIFVKKDVRRAENSLAPGPAKPNPHPQTVSGMVKSADGSPLAGATVYIPKLKMSVETNATGEFILRSVPDGEYEIVISFIGYQKYSTQVRVANHEAWIDAELKQGTGNLDEIVFKGYYSTTNRLNTGDVVTVKGQDIEKQPVSDPLLALEGRVPGMFIQQASGVPGSYAAVRIRGQNSIANGNTPLYIVDGVPFSSTSPTSTIIGGGVLGSPASNNAFSAYGASPFNDLNPGDIESIEVLKDADATAIYGSRGANGVVLITTKKGQPGSTRFDVNAFSGAGKVTRFLHMLNTPQYLEMRHEALNNDGLNPSPNDFDINGKWDTTRYTNWQKVLIGNTAHFNDIQGVLSGGNANTQFRIGAGYSNQGTVYPGSYSDQKDMVDINLTQVSTDKHFHAQFSATYVYDNSNLPQINMGSSITLAPDAPILYDGNGNLNWQVIGGSASWSNPLASTVSTSGAKTDNLISSLNVSYELFKGLELKSNFGYSHLQNNQTNQSPASAIAPPNNNNPGSRSNNFSLNDGHSWIIEPQISYAKNILKGRLNVLLGTTFQQNTQNANGFISSGYPSDALIPDPQAASSVILAGYINSVYHYDAGFMRIGYDWSDKYLVNLTARRDGSSRFGPGRQFGNFGAVGAAWIFSRERFVENTLPWLSFGKLRFSYGTTGNDQLPDYQYLSTYTPYSVSYQGISGLYPTNLYNPYYRWETVKKLEGGIELGFLKDRITITGSYYRNRSGNELVNYPLASLTGFTGVYGNLPALIQNTGAEFTINTINIRTKTLTWRSSVNLSMPTNKLIAYPNLATSSYRTTYAIGKSLYGRQLFHVFGINPTTGTFLYAGTKGPIDTPSSPLDLKTTKPITTNWYGGIDNNISYKGFQLDFLVQFVKQVGYGYMSTVGYGAGKFNTNYPTAVLNRWQKNGDITHYGEFSTKGHADPNAHLGQSDFGIADASFIRLKNVSLSYQLSKKWLEQVRLQNARLFIQCQNLVTITKYFGLDPETQGATLPPLRMLSGGIQITL